MKEVFSLIGDQKEKASVLVEIVVLTLTWSNTIEADEDFSLALSELYLFFAGAESGAFKH